MVDFGLLLRVILQLCFRPSARLLALLDLLARSLLAVSALIALMFALALVAGFRDSEWLRIMDCLYCLSLTSPQLLWNDEAQRCATAAEDGMSDSHCADVMREAQARLERVINFWS
jgi:hypothetical protein